MMTIRKLNILDYCDELDRTLSTLYTIQKSMNVLGLDRASDNLLWVINNIITSQSNIRWAYQEMITDRLKDAQDNSKALLETALSFSAFKTD